MLTFFSQNKTTEFGKSKENLSTVPVIPPSLKALKENINSIPGKSYGMKCFNTS